MANHLANKHEKKELEKIFQSMDTDGNGTLDPDEVLVGYEQHFGIPVTKEQVEEMFKAVDIDQSRSIDFNEFVMATLNESEMVTNEKLKAAFKLFDKDNSGTISPEEIKEVLGIDESNSGTIDKLIAEIDENGDGEI